MTLLILFIFILLITLWAGRKVGAFSRFKNLRWFQYLIVTLQALILAIQIGASSWSLFQKIPQKYSDFVVGNVGFANQNKSVEFYTLYATILAFVILFILIARLYANASESPEFLAEITNIAIYGLVPALIMLGQSLRFSDTHYLLLFSSGATALSVGVIFLLSLLLKKNVFKPGQSKSLGIKLMLIVVFLGLSELGLGIFLRRLGIMPYKRGLITGLCVLIYLVSLIVFRKQTRSIERKVNLGVLLSQLGVPLLFAVLFTPPAKLLEGETVILPYKPFLLVFILGLILVSLFDIFRRFVRENKSDNNGAIKMISPWGLFAILVFLQSTTVYWPGILADEYHSGEFYLPWWSFFQNGYLPYLDYEPARGLVNYVPGFLSWLFYDNSFGAQSLVTNQFSAIYIFIAFFAFRSIVGDFIAFLMVGSIFMFSGLPVGGIVLALAALAIFYKSVSTRTPVQALWIWLGLSIGVSFFQVTEGPIFVVGTLPMVLWLLVQAFHRSKKNLWISLGILTIAGIFLFLNKTTNGLILSTIRYVLDQSAVNDVANGIVWQLPEGMSARVTSGYFWQLIRFSWLFLLIPTVVLLIRNHFDDRSKENQFLLIAVFIMCLIMIPRAAGRIDPVDFSRIGFASIGFVICGLPLVILPNIHQKRVREILPLCLALIFGLIGNQEVQIQTAWGVRGQVIYEPSSTVSGEGLGMPYLGSKVVIDGAQLNRQLQLKTVMEQILKPQETYYDATNHTLDYGIQNRPNPVTNPAPYNLPASAQQLRTVMELEDKQVPLALIWAENILHDGGKLSMRDFIIYEYLVDEYLPFQDEFGYIWMIRRGEESRLSGTGYRIGTKDEQLVLLKQAFWLKDIAGIAAAWGNSMDSLSKELSDPKDLMAAQINVKVNDLILLENGHWMATGPDPYIVFDFPKDFKSDLVYLETDKNVSRNAMQIFWTDDRFTEFNEDQSFLFSTNARKFLIPMSSAPNWLLSDGITSLRIDLPEDMSGEIQFLKVYAYSRPGYEN